MGLIGEYEAAEKDDYLNPNPEGADSTKDGS